MGGIIISFLYAVIASMSAVMLEYMYATKIIDNMWTTWKWIPLALCIQFGIWGLYSHYPKFLGALIIFSSLTFVFRILVSKFVMYEPLTWQIGLAVSLVFLANLLMKLK